MFIAASLKKGRVWRQKRLCLQCTKLFMECELGIGTFGLASLKKVHAYKNTVLNF